jgi:hypothetical protein
MLKLNLVAHNTDESCSACDCPSGECPGGCGCPECGGGTGCC